MREFLLEGWPDELTANEDFLPYKKRADELTVEGGTILWGGRVVIPPKLRSKVLKELHIGHVGMGRMKMLARSYCWWPSMDQQIEEEVANCDACVEHARNPPATIMHPWEMASRPWSRIHIDHAGPFLGRMFLVVVDSMSKWVDVYEVPSTATEHTIEKLRVSFAVQGIPDSVVSDNGSSFTSREFQEFARGNGIRHTTSAPYHPSSNGAAERTVQSFKQTLKKLVATSKETISTQLSRLLFVFRHTPSSVTGVSPAEVLFKSRPRMQLSRLKTDLLTKWRKAADKMIESRPGARPREFAVGAQVIARSYREGEKWIDGIVVGKNGPLSYKIEVNGGVIRRHVDQIRKDARNIINAEFDAGSDQRQRALHPDEEIAPLNIPDHPSIPPVDHASSEPPVQSPAPSVEATDEESCGNPGKEMSVTVPAPPRYPRRDHRPPVRLGDCVR